MFKKRLAFIERANNKAFLFSHVLSNSIITSKSKLQPAYIQSKKRNQSKNDSQDQTKSKTPKLNTQAASDAGDFFIPLTLLSAGMLALVNAEEKENADKQIAENIQDLTQEIANRWRLLRRYLTALPALKTHQELYLTTWVSSENLAQEANVCQHLQQIIASIHNNCEELATYKKQLQPKTYQYLEEHLNLQKHYLLVALALEEAFFLHKKHQYKQALEKINQGLNFIESTPTPAVADIPVIPSMQKETLQICAYNRKAKLYRCLNEYFASFETYQKALALNEIDENARGDILYSQGFLLIDLGSLVYSDELAPEKLSALITELRRVYALPYAINFAKPLSKLQTAELCYHFALCRQKNALELKGKNPHILSAMATTIHKQEYIKPVNERSQINLKKAQTLFDEALSCEGDTPQPVFANIYFYYGDLLLDVGKQNAALEKFKEAIARNPAVLYSINYQLSQRGLLKQAMNLTKEQQDKLSVNQIDLYEQLAMLQQWQVQQKAPEIKKALPLSPELSPEKFGIIQHKTYVELSHQVYFERGGQAPAGWEVLKTQEEGSYFGAAYINRQLKHIVIAHRGTEVHLTDMITDFNLMNQWLDGQFRQAIKLTDAILLAQKERYPNYVVSQTGHSLGGALAESAAYFRNLPAVTFDSPGVYQLIKRNLKTHTKKTVEVDETRADILCYLATPNLINCANQHIGRLIRVYPVVTESGAQMYHKIRVEAAKMPVIGSMLNLAANLVVTPVVEIKTSFARHALVGIRALFHEEEISKQPQRQDIVEDWPVGPHDYFQYNQYIHQFIHEQKPSFENYLEELNHAFTQRYLAHYVVKPRKRECLAMKDLSSEIAVPLEMYLNANFAPNKNLHDWDEVLLKACQWNPKLKILHAPSGWDAEELRQYLNQQYRKTLEYQYEDNLDGPRPKM